MVAVTSASRYITSESCYHPRYQVDLDVHPWSYSTEFRGINRGSSDCIVIVADLEVHVKRSSPDIL